MYTNHGCVIICQEHGKNFAGTMSKTFELSCLIAHFLLCSLYNILEKNLLLMYQKSKEKVKEDNFNAMKKSHDSFKISTKSNLSRLFSFSLMFVSKFLLEWSMLDLDYYSCFAFHCKAKSETRPTLGFVYSLSVCDLS